VTRTVEVASSGSEQWAMTGADTRAGAAAVDRSRVLAESRVPRMPLHLRGLLF